MRKMIEQVIGKFTPAYLADEGFCVGNNALLLVDVDSLVGFFDDLLRTDFTEMQMRRQHGCTIDVWTVTVVLVAHHRMIEKGVKSLMGAGFAWLPLVGEVQIPTNFRQ